MKRSTRQLFVLLVGIVIVCGACVSSSQQRQQAGPPADSSPPASPSAPSAAPPAAPYAAPVPKQDCLSFDPATATMAQIQGSWKIVDGSHWLFDFGGKLPEAKQALTIIQYYGFTRSCFVGRPRPSFKYLRK